ncbi:histidine kinase [Chloroflexota bacterium]
MQTEPERRHIARELHDDVSTPLLLLIQSLDAITSDTRPRLSGLLKEKLEELRSQAGEALENLRRSSPGQGTSIMVNVPFHGNIKARTQTEETWPQNTGLI